MHTSLFTNHFFFLLIFNNLYKKENIFFSHPNDKNINYPNNEKIKLDPINFLYYESNNLPTQFTRSENSYCRLKSVESVS